MPIAVTIKEVRETVRQWRKEGLSVGLVPTMGYLHEGHESLIKRAVAENDRVVVSVFVNPMQFGPKEDLASYPRDIEADSRLCEAAGASLIFHPEPEEMYEEGFCSFVDMTGLTNALCGLSRPVHFRGVCTVVNKLFNIVMPDRAYFGEKDAQQLAVVKRMVKDLNMDIEIVGCPIIREADGLAKSSRNTYLSPESRKQAVILSKSIFMAKKMIEDGERDAAKVKQAMVDMINTMPLADIDYVEIVDVNTMQSIDKIEGDILCAIAVNIGGEARLIDNFMLSLSNA
ncbi:MAG: pantoate--beta-alanine ligase [Clostridium sp.]|nr:pantoate--beta-alanine ligase [Clostridium sp.]MCM1173101.1 pantoate--beta-alanine ligase [Clostridium sp.]MCM1208100.1 pantoate--beta-alanine ligase [Ruminococcus sp.]